MLAISCSVSASSASTVTVFTPLSFPPTPVDLSTDGPLPLLSELSHLTRFFSSETVVGILGAVLTLFRVTASEAAVFSAAWVAAVVVGAGDVEDVMTPVAVAVAAAVVVLPVAASVGAAVLAFAVVTDFAVVATTVVAVASTVVAVATTVVAVAAGAAVAGAGAVGSEEGVTVAVSSSRLSTPALFRYACNM
jgi:hypothetical protein